MKKMKQTQCIFPSTFIRTLMPSAASTRTVQLRQWGWTTDGLTLRGLGCSGWKTRIVLQSTDKQSSCCGVWDNTMCVCMPSACALVQPNAWGGEWADVHLIKSIRAWRTCQMSAENNRIEQTLIQKLNSLTLFPSQTSHNLFLWYLYKDNANPDWCDCNTTPDTNEKRSGYHVQNNFYFLPLSCGNVITHIMIIQKRKKKVFPLSWWFSFCNAVLKVLNFCPPLKKYLLRHTRFNSHYVSPSGSMWQFSSL